MIYKITIFNTIKNELQFTDTEGTISPLSSHTIIEDDVYVESADISLDHDSYCSQSNISINETPSSHTVIRGENIADIDHCLVTPQPIKRLFIFFIYFTKYFLNTYII